MVTVIKKGSKVVDLKKQIEKALETKGVDTYKHCGVIKLKEDPLLIQKRMRNEWE